MRQHELPTRTIQALWRMAGEEGITIEELRKRLLDERLEHVRLKRERRKGKIVTEIRLDENTHVVALSKETLKVLSREAGKASCTIDELVENWLEEWYAMWVKGLEH